MTDSMLLPGFGVAGLLSEIVPDWDNSCGVRERERLAGHDGIPSAVLSAVSAAEIPTQPSHAPLPPDQHAAYWMQEALRTSMRSCGRSNPNPAVGCVIVTPSGQELARGHTEAFGGRHAERVAFDAVRDPRQLKGAHLFTTLEPCAHQGQQPACADFLQESEVQHFSCARLDPNPLVAGAGLLKLKNAGKSIQLGTLAAEVTALNFPFFAFHAQQPSQQRPLVILKWAQTLDGQLADDQSHSQWITGPASRAYAHGLRRKYDAILVGAQTWLRDQPQLTVRDCKTLHHPPEVSPTPRKILFDPRALASDHAPAQLTDWTVITTQAQAHRYHGLGNLAHSHLPPQPTTLNLPRLIALPGRDLEQEWCELLLHPSLHHPAWVVLPAYPAHLTRPLQSILVEGGPKTLTFFLQAGLGDLFHLFIAPTLTGGLQNRVSLGLSLSQALKLHRLALFQLGPDTVIELSRQPLPL